MLLTLDANVRYAGGVRAPVDSGLREFKEFFANAYY
jgi:hypothetical protein